MDPAPIALFVYNRPAHTLRTLEALIKNDLAKDSVLYVFQDGLKKDATPEDAKKMHEVDAIVNNIRGFSQVITYKKDNNIGLAESIINGVSLVVNKHGRIIVLEDDIITSPYFLRYLNDGLQVYEKVNNVYAVNAYMFPIATDTATTFLSPLGTSTWGWATWSDKWNIFEYTPLHKKTIQQNKFLRARFNLADYNYADMLDNTNSWGIRWYYSVFMRNGLGVFPTKSLCYNIGFGEESTHTKGQIHQMEMWSSRISVELLSEIDIDIYSKILTYFSVKEKAQKVRLLNRIWKKIRKLLG
jgi:hypothetical protein